MIDSSHETRLKLRFEIFTSLKINTACLRIITLYSLVGNYQLSEEHFAYLCKAEVTSTLKLKAVCFSPKFGTRSPDYTASQRHSMNRS
jgi:hypothetical protein